MRTIVRNLITNEELLFCNGNNKIENMVNAVLHVTNKMSQLYNDKLRSEIKNEIEIIQSKKSGCITLYHEKTNLVTTKKFY